LTTFAAAQTILSNCPLSGSPDQPQGELCAAGQVSLAHNAAEIRAGRVPVRRIEQRPVEEIELMR
jgi:hypothetical protein